MNFIGAELKLPRANELLQASYVVLCVVLLIVLGVMTGGLTEKSSTMIFFGGASSAFSSALNLRFGRSIGDSFLTILCFVFGYFVMNLFFV